MKVSRVKKYNIYHSLEAGGLGTFISIILTLIFKQYDVIFELSLLGFVIGTLLGLFEHFVSQPKLKKLRFLFVILINSAVYTLTILVSVGIFALIKMSIAHQCTIIEAIERQSFFGYIVESNLHILLIILVAISFFMNLVFRVSHLLGPGVLWNLMIGRYHKPTPAERIFLFLDIDGSTAIAERLGTKKYSEFLQDFFLHISEPLLKTRGRVFQYVGDEVVIVWTRKDGFEDNNALRFFFYYQECISNHKDYYLNKYGFIPEFKAGYHFGETIISEVGDIKKEIVYHGDLVNTASRIRSASKEINKRILISKNFLTNMHNVDGFELEDLGEIELKGKTEKVNLFSVSIEPNYISQLC